MIKFISIAVVVISIAGGFWWLNKLLYKRAIDAAQAEMDELHRHRGLS